MHRDFIEHESPIKEWAISVKTGEKIHIDDAYKDNGPYKCPYSSEVLIPRHCIEKRDHFAYKFRKSQVYGKGESREHRECKEEICEELRKAYPEGNWATERPLKGSKDGTRPDLRPDISGRMGKRPVVIEVQASALTLDTINKRVLGYNKFNDPINIVWIIPLKEELGDATFRPRLYEWYLHSMYYGRVYYWIKGMGAKVIPVHFDKTDRWIPETSWYNEFGEEEVAGGYAKDYKTIVKPNFGEVCDLRNFKERRREEFIPENEKKAVPKCHIFMDRLKKWW